MSEHVYHLLHVGGVVLLTAMTFQAFGARGPKRRVMIYTGFLSAVVLVAGFALLSKLGLMTETGLRVPGWILVKFVCWLGLAAMAGIAFRRPGAGSFLALVTSALVLLAIYMVYWRPALGG